MQHDTSFRARPARALGLLAPVFVMGPVMVLVIGAAPLASALSSDTLPPVNSAGGPSRALTTEEAALWLEGRRIFDMPFHRSRGLGFPVLNGDSCRACHEDPVMGGAGGLEANVSRFAFDNGGAGPYQDLPGGQAASKLHPPYVDGREEVHAQADVFEQRQTPTLLGAGLIDTIPEVAILANEDPLDTNGDGITGVARLIPVQGGGLEVGRFGWKAQLPRLADFTRDAMANELGITTPDDGRGFAPATDGDPVADPELTQPESLALNFFLAHLAAPQRKGSTAPEVAQGEAVFAAVGCALCHVPSLPGAGGPVPLYSDLLLHEVMAPGFRGMEEPGAPAGSFRTPPLWGIGDTAPYLHDGRAETLLAAILAHDGEAAGVRAAFQAAAPADQDALIAFLEDL